ncbi:Imm42 family immunity protein [Brucella pituitosa]
MIVGNRKKFAIESNIKLAYAKKSLLALGFFVVYVNGKRYGVRKDDATMLANSYDSIIERIKKRGSHVVESLNNESAQKIAEAYRDAFYEDDSSKKYFGWDGNSFQDVLIEKGIVLAPDGDAAFDDGGHVLHFDEPNSKTRLIAFFNEENRSDLMSSVQEIYLEESVFYEILEQWAHLFISEWNLHHHN